MPRPVISNGTKPSKSNVLSRIKSIEFDESEGISIIVYGQSGAGKTTFVSTFPGPSLWVICSGGIKSGELRSVPPKDRDKIKQVILQESSEFKEVLDALNSGELNYNTVVLDHVSGFQDRVLADILGLEELPTQKSWGLATQQQYGQCTQQCKEYLRSLLNLKCNRVIIGQERVFGDENTDSELLAPTVGVAVTPSLAGWLAPACDFMIQCYKRPKMDKLVTKVGGQEIVTESRGKGIEYCARTEAHDVFMTKLRVPRGFKVPSCIVDPSYSKLMSVIRGEYGKEVKKVVK